MPHAMIMSHKRHLGYLKSSLAKQVSKCLHLMSRKCIQKPVSTTTGDQISSRHIFTSQELRALSGVTFRPQIRHFTHSVASIRSISSKRRVENKFPELRTSLEAQTLLDKNLLLWLRDACTCPQCLDRSTSQKLFQTCDIPATIEARILQETDAAFKVAWRNDIPGLEPEHVSEYSKHSLLPWLQTRDSRGQEFATATSNENIVPWGSSSSELLTPRFHYDDYLASDGVLRAVLLRLKTQGLVILKDVPKSENAVELIASRIGHLRETFYGRTWDVRSMPQAKNVAYTNLSLGFHMDLLYMSDPPGLQLLHCLENSCVGGTSLFADGFQAAVTVKQEAKARFRREQRMDEVDRETGNHYEILTEFDQLFHYRNEGHHYCFKRPVIQVDTNHRIEAVNWSPPFQAPFERTAKVYRDLGRYVKAAKQFAGIIENPLNQYEYRMEKGDCVIFNNRRILHGRRAFDTSAGERWLKGAYVDTDVFNSRCRELLQSTEIVQEDASRP